MVRLVAVGLIVIGLVIMVWPQLQQTMHMQEEQALVESFEQMNDHLEPRAQASLPTSNAQTQDDDVYGLIHIDRIELTLPLLDDVSEPTLDVGAGLIRQGHEFGEPGNIGIAAHRSRTAGRLFSSLDRLEPGDIVTVETKGKTIEYEVFQRSIVTPDDIEVLNHEGNQSLVTLITCTNDGKRRLIVQAKNNRL